MNHTWTKLSLGFAQHGLVIGVGKIPSICEVNREAEKRGLP